MPSPATASEKGARCELAVATALVDAGFRVFMPFFAAHGRVDVVYENAAREFRRVQCKSARLVGDVVVFSTCSHTGGVERCYVDEAEEFGVYCPATGEVYLVPVHDVPVRVARLRLGPARNNQTKRVRWAEPYRLRSPN